MLNTTVPANATTMPDGTGRSFALSRPDIKTTGWGAVPRGAVPRQSMPAFSATRRRLKVLPLGAV